MTLNQLTPGTWGPHPFTLRAALASVTLGIAFALCGGSASATPPPRGIAPVVVPAGGFSIDGDLLAKSPLASAGDWLLSTNSGSGGWVLNSNGTPVNAATTFHFTDLYNTGSDDDFVGGKKWTDDPNTWKWTISPVSSKTDINNALLHIATDTNGHSWVIVAADRLSTSGYSYIDFEFLQNSLVRTNNGGFVSAGPNGGRTTNDLLLSLAFTGGGSTADFFAWRWLSDGSGGFNYVDVTASLPAGRVFVAANTNTVAVSYGAFGQPTYAANAFVEAAVDLTGLLGAFDPCLSIGVKAIMVKTKSSQSSTATIEDFIDPIQYTLKLGPSANAGPDQTRCTEGEVTTFPLQGVAAPGLQPVTSTAWSLLSGTATIDSPGSLTTTAHVSSASATLRLTVLQANGCTETDDVVLTVAPLPVCSISGPALVCPQSSRQFSGPSGMSAYRWSIAGNGLISGATNAQLVTVSAGSACGTNFTLALTVVSNSCSSTCSSDILVNDTVAPTVTAPADRVLECPADTRTNVLGVATAQDDCGKVTVTYSDLVTTNCGGSRVVARLWTAIDLCGNAASALQTITVRDTTVPSLTIPTNRVLECPADISTNNTGTATAADACSSVVVTYSDSSSNSCGGANVILRTWTATDACGNSTNRVQTITVRDTTRPTLAIPSDQVLECPADTTTNTTGLATAQDTCNSVVVTYSDSVTNNCGGAKVIARTWTARDACGNSTNRLQTITVRDSTRPILTLPSDQILECPADTTTNNTGVATAEDTCSSIAITYSDSVTNNCTGTKVIARTWLATDACNNRASAVQTITVRDTTPPGITAPPDLTLECPADTRTNVTGMATALDGCSAVTITYNDVVTTNCGGTRVIVRTWTATDKCNNSASAAQTITVQDTTPPSLGIPSNRVLDCPADTSTNNTGMATAQDGCGPAVVTYEDTVTNNCGGTKVIARTWTATDACGNSTNRIQMITVRDITAPSLAIPPNLTLECPADTSTNNTGAATAHDACSSFVISYSDSVTNNCGGTEIIARTWTARDDCGNTTNRIQTITVRDTKPPVITPPLDMTLECPADTTTNNTGVATAADACNAVTITYSDVVSNRCSGTLVIARTWTASDACNNSASAVQTITVRDTILPALMIPSDQVLECPADTTTNNTGIATAQDSCSAVTVTYSDQTTTNCGGTKVIARTWTARDGCGNTTNRVQTITVRDTTPPFITAPLDLILECPADARTNATGMATAHDGCNTVVITYSDVVSNGCGGTKVIARTWTATDACNNSASALQTIMVQDTTAPSLGIPSNRTIECPADTTTNNTGIATAQDGCGSVVVSYEDAVTNNCGGTKVIARTWTAVDDCGNRTNRVQMITVQDLRAPSLNIPADVTLECPADTTTNNTGVATAQDACSSFVVTYSDTVTNNCGGTKVIWRRWTATDACGNSTNRLQTITVRDTTAPSIAPPPNLTLECPADTTTNNTGVAIAQDGCGSVLVTYLDAITNNCGGTKVIARTWTATDACNNSASAIQTITVQDTTRPILNIPADRVLECPVDTSTNNTGVATAQDSCSSLVITYSDMLTNNCGGSKVIARTWTATDACGNSTNRVQTITVRDTTQPTLAIPSDKILECPADTTTNNTGIALAQDTCSSVVVTYSDAVTNGCGGSSVIARTWTARDACGNTTNRLQTITVRDTTRPSLSLPPDQVLECPAITTTNVTGAATAQDTCSSVMVTYSDSVTNNCAGTKVIARTWTATDACGNSTNRLQTITVRDTTPPSIIPPQNLTQECPGDTRTNVTGVATALDGCGSVSISYSDIVSNNCGGTKVITRTWTATDACNNSASALQTITVRDLTPPSLSLPSNRVLDCPADTSTNNTGVATAQDGCGSVVVTYSDVVTNNCSGTKVISRTWTATDSCGNTTNRLQTITVQDLTAPSLSIPSNVTLECPADTTTNNTGVATAQDACSSVTITYSDTTTNNCGGTKVVSRRWTATDACGNATNRVQTITVRDSTPPSLTLPANLVLECPADTTTNNTGVATAQDGCGSVTIRYSDSVSNICGGARLISRTWTAADSCGNSTNALQTITVRDTTPPVITVPADVTLDCGAGTSPSATGTATAQDACGSATVTYSDVVSNICGGSKVITRTWTAADGCGNRTNGVQIISVLDRTPPSISFALPPACTYSQGGWGGGGYPGQVLQSNYTTVFADGLTLGIYSPANGTAPPNGLLWEGNATGLAALQIAVGQNSGSGLITQDALNPSGTYGAGSLGRQALALALNIGFNTAGVLGGGPNSFGSLIYTNSGGDSLSGLTPSQILNAANQALAGMAFPAGYDASSLTALLNNLNISFEGCAVSSWAVAHLNPALIVVFSCASQVPPADPAAVTASDSCSSPVIVTNLPDRIVDYTCPSHYTLQRSWVAKDACGNTNTLSYLIQVLDVTPPALSVPANLTLECPADTSTNVTGTAAAQDSCGSVTITYSDVLSNSCGGANILLRTWTASDGCNSTNRVQTIAVRDSTAPSITPPPSLTQECPGDVRTNVTGVATASDGCSSVLISFNDVVSTNCGGTKIIARTWMAMDACNNSASALQTITIRDSTPPSLIVPSNRVLTCPADTSTNNTGVAIAQDGCGSVVVSYSDVVSNNCGGTKIILRTWMAADACGNNTNGLQTITVQDLAAPSLAIPPDASLECPADTSTNNTGMAIAHDACSAATVTYSDTVTNNCGGTEIIARTWTATDACGNRTNRVQTITVRDTKPPVITPPQDLTLECPADTSTNHTGVATAQDGCNAVTITYSDVASNGCGGSRVITRTWNATDACNNSASAVQTITVRDTRPPTLDIPSDRVLECPADTSTNNTGTAAAQDLCSAVTVSYADVTTTNCGGTKVIARTWTARDGCGNSTNRVQTITVRDTTPPSILPPPDLTLDCPADTSTNNTGMAAAQDGCGSVVITFSDTTTNNCGGTKVIARLWTATDACGNSVHRVQTITVRDTAAPSLAIPPDATLECPADTSTNNTGMAIAHDACSAATVTYSDTVTNNCGGTEIIARAWTATDACGNSTNRVQTITVRDTKPPVITPPQDLTLECPADTSTNHTGVATAQDGCNAVTIGYSDVASNGCSGAMVIARTWTASDACNNSASVVQTITIRDTRPPTLDIPSDRVLECPADTSTNNTGTAAAQDSCSAIGLSYSDRVTTNCSGTKVIARTWTAADACGNTTNRVQTITVRDIAPPTLTIVSNRTVSAGQAWAFDDPIATDTCSAVIVTIVNTATNLTAQNTTAITRTWQGTDGCGNVSFCQQTVTILSAPTISSAPLSQTIVSGQSSTLRVTTTGSGPFTYQWCLNGTNIAGATGSSFSLTGQFANAGLYNVVVSNAAGTTTSQVAVVNVAPVLSIRPNGRNVTLSWQGPFVLQSADDTTGPYSDLIERISGTTFDTASASQKFFRLRSQPFSLTTSWLPGGKMCLSTPGVPGCNLILQASTNLINWVNVATNPSPCAFVDNDAPQYPRRFYRAVMAQTGPVRPKITAQPQSRTVNYGTNTTLSVTATGDGPFTYQWRLNGANIAGATGSSLSLSGVQFANAGLYTVTVGNACGSVTSGAAVLNVDAQLYTQIKGHLMTLTWPAPYILQSSTNSAGPFRAVPGATSPYVIDMSTTAPRFFQLGQPPFSLTAASLSGGQCRVSTPGVPGQALIIQASTNLSHWVSLCTNASPCTYVDGNASQYPHRFYRAKLAH